MRSRLTPLALATILLVACQDSPLTPGRAVQPADPMLSAGGILGPPPFVLIPTPPGPPPRVPVPLPPRAGPPSFLRSIVAVGAGGGYSCALRSDGVAYCWGANNFGQLGNGSVAPSSVPVEVSGSTRFVRLFTGDVGSCGLTSGGAAYCWGDNSVGQVGAGLPAGSARVLVPAPVVGGHSFLELSIGLRSTCGIAADGVTYCWGQNAQGQLGIGSAGGFSNIPIAVVNSAALGFVTVSVGLQNACALTNTGATYCWGGQPSQFGNPTTPPNTFTPTPAASGAAFASIESGSLYTCAVDGVGAAFCWGSQTSGELGMGSLATRVQTPTAVVGGLSFASFDSHNNNSVLATTCGLTVAGAAWCWGSDRAGQLGAPGPASCTFGPLSYACSATPVQVSGGVVFKDIAVGLDHECAIDVSGDVWCWGSNAFGQLGDGTMVSSSTPVRASGLNAPARLGSVVVSPTQPLPLRFLGSTQQFTAQLLDEAGVPVAPQPAFTWSSSNPAVAPVGATGLATALTTGSTTITATAPNGWTGSTPLTVNILNPSLAFQQAWLGTTVGTVGTTDGVVVLGGLLADEWSHSGTFPTRREVDQRSMALTNLTVDQAYSRLALARTALEFEVARLMGVNPSDPRIGELLALAGYAYLAFAENFCSGVPLDDPNVGLSTADLLNLASVRFSQSLSGPVSAPFNVLATVGAARAQLALGNYAAAAAMVAGVPTAFVYATTHSGISGDENFVYSMNTLQRRITLADGEGTNGLPFRTASDPRVPWTFFGVGFNGLTQQYNLLKYSSLLSPVTVASGTEARLIEAEAALQGGSIAAYLSALNALRAIASLPAVVDPGSAAARVDLLFRERAFWLFATGSRLGDVRRLINQYGRAPGTVLPVGPYPLGGSYGSDANLPVPASARGGAFAGCTNRGS